VDAAGNAYIGGFTTSTNFPMVNARQTSSNTTSGGNEGFVTKLGLTGAIEYSTYHGSLGDPLDYVDDIAVDASGNAYVVGDTTGDDFPILNAFQSIRAGGEDVFLSKLSPSGALSYSTYLGGIDWEYGADVTVD